jgi:imidazole glycerol phosphate synthase glutamine amidotransferase subunit
LQIGILDYGAGNLRSVLNAFSEIGQTAALVREPSHFDSLDLLVFPGQGAFGDCTRQLNEAELLQPLKAWLKEQKPYLGICLGYQLLFDSSEENPGVTGLSSFDGKVVRFPRTQGLKVPHMGWNTVKFTHPEESLWRGLGDQAAFYFVHSYFPAPSDAALAGCHTEYGGLRFASGIVRDKLVAVQFHPEKSQKAGLALLRNAVEFLR